jgi:hypothetical protein
MLENWDILNDNADVKKISRLFAFKAKADSKNRLHVNSSNCRTCYRSPRNFQKVIHRRKQTRNPNPAQSLAAASRLSILPQLLYTE